jgi:hypothetical protein
MSANSLDGGHLKAFIERIDRLEEEKRRSPTTSTRSMPKPGAMGENPLFKL